MGLQALARDAWYSREPGMGAYLLSIILMPVSYLYGAWMHLRRARIVSRPALAATFDLRVIAIGNLTLGGSAKTPVTMMIAKLLMEQGKKPVIISRGYKGSLEGKTALVSDGEKIFFKARQAGDEPVMMARGLASCPVVIGAKRADAIRFAKENLDIDCAVLDDSFQHIAVARDLNILCVNGALGFGNSRVFPSGPLREPLSAARQADLCLITGYGQALPGIEEKLKQTGFNGKCLNVKFTPGKFTDLNANQLSLSELEGKRAIALTSIAHPDVFFKVAAGLSLQLIDTAAFADHHEYKTSDFQRLDRLAKEGSFEYYVTTVKDAAKLAELGHDFPVPVVAVEMEPQMDRDEYNQLIDALKGVM